jgi:Ca2+-binding EF-hand superfamily protein
MRSQLLAAAVLLTLPGIGQAQSQRDADIRFQAMDRNRDRVITRDEWRGSARSFDVHDWNGDGVLSGEEVRLGATRRNRPELDFDQNAEFNDWTPRGFRSLDHDGDGRISRAEWHFNQESFIRADRNRDGILSRGEFLGEGADDDREDRFDSLDSNRNGRIEIAEWHGGRRDFDWLDRNNDGTLSRDEVVGNAAGRNDTFASLDINRNGTISFNEWHWSRSSFDARDSNRDGVVSRNEFVNTGAVGTSGRDDAQRTITVPATERWVDSGIDVRRSDILEITASGTVTMSGPSDAATPEGSRTGRRAPDAPLPQQLAGALVMRIGDSQPILIGESRTVRAPQDGRVYFTVNDDHLPDNSGEFRVTVRVQRRGE